MRVTGAALALLFVSRNLTAQTADSGVPLERQLAVESPTRLGAAARAQGDARRGAVLFHRPQAACAKCHAVSGIGMSLGPDLAMLPKDTTDLQIVESLLFPSRVIRPGFEAVIVATRDGRQIAGVVVEETGDRIVLRDGAEPTRLVPLQKSEIDDRTVSKRSLMPDGQVNQLGNRDDFLDLLRYLIELRDGGPARAAELQPPPAAYALQVPEYEHHLDHAGLIGGLGDAAYQRGERVYHRHCINCHGTPNAPGSLPTSLRFARDRFKNGSDPFAMYKTLTNGFGMMTPQVQLVPQQKYDVIHFIREAYLRRLNASQYARVDAAYLAGLPRGDTRGPEPVVVEPWRTMDYGPNLIHTYEVGRDASNFAHKGIAVRLDAGPGGVARGRAWVLFDHDTLRLAAAWTGDGFVDWEGIQFNGRHGVHPRLVGDINVSNPAGPGWADPATGRFDDRRLRGRDGRPYGPLPRAWAQYRGLYHHGDRVILSYTVGDAGVLDMSGIEWPAASRGPVVFTRTLDVGRASHDLVLCVATTPVAAELVGGRGARLVVQEGVTRLHIPAPATPLRCKLLVARPGTADLPELARRAAPAEPLAQFTRGSPPRWIETMHTTTTPGRDDGPFAVDVLVHPEWNPWQCQMRFTGLDFFPGGQELAVCTWDGDVWRVCGLDRPAEGLTWQRIASGLFQPLGLKIVDGTIYLTCRDQLVRLRDLNGDGKTDFYECFNNDHQVTEHFHEFAMGLQVDEGGNFYYAKSARHALPALVPHHGTLLRVSQDGRQTDILATGFRAANGVCLNPDGSFFVTDQEGHWTPKNRINHVTPGKFYGNMWGYHGVTDRADTAMEPPVCWITNRFDRSPAELLWVPRGTGGSLAGSLLNLSYGNGQIYVVPHETIGGRMQGGMAAFPLPVFPTGIMRGRFNPADGQLYVCGMYSWAGNQTQPGGLYRIRATGKPAHLPIGLRARQTGLEITFSDPLDTRAMDDGRFVVRSWSLKRTANYGSEHYDERVLPVSHLQCTPDGRTVRLEIPTIQPTWCMEVRYAVRGQAGERVEGTIHHTIHRLADAP
jgi:putative heme-binding domain-containing protein